MDYQVLFVITLVALVAVAIFAVVQYRDRDKYLFRCKPLERDCEKLKEENEKLRLRLPAEVSEKRPEKKADAKSEKKAEKPTAEKRKADVSELTSRVAELKKDVSRLKEENFNLKKDNKSLRQEMRENRASNTTDQREIVALREKASDLEELLNEARARIKTLETAKPAQEDPVAVDAIVEARPEDVARISELERENVSLSSSLKDVRGELASFKRDFRNQLDAAKQEVAESNRGLRRDVSRAVRQAEQSKKRADNNHKIYLIARAQLQLVERRLMGYEPEYTPLRVLPVSDEAIDESVKKFVTRDARETRAASSLPELERRVAEQASRIAELERENAALRTSKLDDISFSSLSDGRDESDDSLSTLVNALAVEEPQDVKTSALDTSSLADLDLGHLDDEWETV